MFIVLGVAMRFTLTQLLLAFPAFFLSLYLVAPFVPTGRPFPFLMDKWKTANRDIGRLTEAVKRFSEQARAATGAEPSADFINLWLAGDFASSHPAAQRFWSSPPKRDPWDRAYYYVALGENGEEIGIYSLGQDGVTTSSGNDPDDLSSWNDRSGAWYEQEELTRKRTWQTIMAALLTPFLVYGGQWAARRLRALGRRSNDKRRGSDEGSQDLSPASRIR